MPDHGRHYPAWATTKRDDWCGEHEHTRMQVTDARTDELKKTA